MGTVITIAEVVLAGPQVLDPALELDVDDMRAVLVLAAWLAFFAVGARCNRTCLMHVTSAGAAGVGLGTAAGVGTLLWLGVGWAEEALLIGFLLSAGGLALTGYRGARGLAALQAVIVLLALLLLQALEGVEAPAIFFFRYFFICVAFVTLAFVLGERAVPKLLHRATQAGGRGGQRATVFALCLGTTLFAWWIGPGGAFAAFVAGFLISERHAAVRPAPPAPTPSRRESSHTEPFVVLNGTTAQKTPRLRLVAVEAGSPAAQVPLDQLALRRHYRVDVLGVWHQDAYLAPPPRGYRPAPGDRIVLSARPDRLARSAQLFRTPHARSG